MFAIIRPQLRSRVGRPPRPQLLACRWRGGSCGPHCEGPLRPVAQWRQWQQCEHERLRYSSSHGLYGRCNVSMSLPARCATLGVGWANGLIGHASAPADLKAVALVTPRVVVPEIRPRGVCDLHGKGMERACMPDSRHDDDVTDMRASCCPMLAGRRGWSCT